MTDGAQGGPCPPGLKKGSPQEALCPPGPWAGRGFAQGAHESARTVLPWEHSLTCARHRATGNPGTPRKRAAGSRRCTGTRCRGTGHGHCTQTPEGSGSRSWTAHTGRPSPRSPLCRGTCHRSIPPDLEDSKATRESLSPRPSDLALCSPGLRSRSATTGLTICPHRALTITPADFPIIALAVDIVTLAELPEDLLIGHVTCVAQALPADAVPQPRADDGVVVFATASFQLLAAAALRLALAILPNVASITPGPQGRGQGAPDVEQPLRPSTLALVKTPAAVWGACLGVGSGHLTCRYHTQWSLCCRRGCGPGLRPGTGTRNSEGPAQSLCP